MGKLNNSLNILQISTVDIAGGAERVAWNLFREYRRYGHRPWLAVGRKNSADPNVIEIPNDIYRNFWARFWRKVAFRVKRLDGKLKGAWRMYRLLTWFAEPEREVARTMGIEDFVFPGTLYLLKLLPEPPDVIHYHNLHGGYFDLRALSWLSKRVSAVLTLHDAWLLSGHCAHSLDCKRWKAGCGQCPYLTAYPPIKRDRTAYNWRRKRDIYAKSQLYISTPSHWLMHKVEQSILAPAILEAKVIPNGVNLTVFHPGDQREARATLGVPQDAKVLLFVGNATRSNTWKNYALLKVAVGRVAERLSKHRVILICLGEEQKPVRVGRAELRFIGYQKDLATVVRFYQAADIYLHAAKADTFPNTILEALACGKPVVATAVGGIPEQVEDGINGFLVSSRDAEAMAACIEQLLSDDGLRYKFSLAAMEAAHCRFDLNRQVNDYLEWYKEILGR